MQNIALLVHVVAGALLILFILIQDKGVGFGSAIGGSGGGGFYASKRGAAKVIHRITVLVCIVFFSAAISYVLLPADPSLPEAAPGATAPAGTPPSASGGTPVEVKLDDTGTVGVEAVPE